jgi:type VI protein secretion system component Hcp
MITRKTNPMLKGPAKVAAWLKDFIGGDSLDVPFVNWIRIRGVEHSIGFGSESAVASSQPNLPEHLQADDPLTGFDQTTKTSKTTHWGTVTEKEASRWGRSTAISFGNFRSEQAVPAGGFLTQFKNNQFVNISLPEHGQFKLTKFPDNATPQLAFACTAQEPIENAIFCFRRRIGTGVFGVRLPFLTVQLQKCLVTSWGLDGDLNETVTIKYKKITWCTYDQMTDWNAPTGMSAREWDVEEQAGGENRNLYILMGLLAAAVSAAGLAMGLGGAEGGIGVEKG